MPLILQYKSGTGTPITEWATDTLWQAGDIRTQWTGSAWYYDGDYGGCDGCGASLDPIGTWADGFRPTSVDVTYQTIGVINGHNGWITLRDPSFNTIGTANTQVAAGTYTVNIPLTFLTEDIHALAFYGGDCTGCTNYDREMYITSIVFNS